MKTRTINLIYLVSIVAIIIGGVFLLYGDVYFWITGNRFNDSQVLSDTDKKSQIPTIDTNALAAKVNNKEKFLLLDVRTLQEFEVGHIKEAVSLPMEEIDNQIGKLELAKNEQIITMCDGTGCNRSDQAAAKLIGLGFSNVVSYHDGITAWKLAGKPVVTSSVSPDDYISLFKDFKTQQISVADAKKKIDSGNVVVIDVQEQQDNAAENIAGSIFMELSGTADMAESKVIPKGKTIIFYSEDGSRSNIATQTFINKGYTQSYSLKGGIHAWKEAGYAVAHN